MSQFDVPAEICRVTTTAGNSRFYTAIANVTSVAQAKQFLARIRDEMPDATHYAYAFRIGFGNTVIEGMSDDGEPSGTAGPPILAILRGTNIGDIIIIVTRYFGGTKLGTGGLVRAYSTAARTALGDLKTERKTIRKLLGIETPYNLYKTVTRLIAKYNGEVKNVTYTQEVVILALFPVDDVPKFTSALANATAGRLEPVVLSDNDTSY